MRYRYTLLATALTLPLWAPFAYAQEEQPSAPPAAESSAVESTPTEAKKEEAKKADTAVTDAEKSKESAAEQSPAKSAKTGDHFIDTLVATYTSNPRILAERKRQESTDEQVAQAVSGFRPQAGITYDKGRQRTAFGSSAWSYGDTEGKTLRIEQPLFRGGGTLSSYSAARQRVQAGRYQLAAVEQEVMLQAVAAYMDVLTDTSLLELARNNRDVLMKQLEAANERFAVGEVTKTDVAQSEARVSQAKTQVIAAEGRLVSSVAEFERIVGYKPEAVLTAPKTLPELPATMQEALEQGRLANPQLLGAIHATKAAGDDVWTSKSALLPRASLVGSMSRQDGAGVLGTSTFDQDSVKLEVTIPLYQSGSEYSRVRQSKSTERQRQDEQQNTKQSVEESIVKSWERLQTATDTIRTRQDQIKAAQVALDGVKQEQEYGARTVLDVLDAEQELFVAKTNLVQAERDRIVAGYNVLLTLGRLNPSTLELPVTPYDPTENYDRVKWLPIGF